MYDFTDIEEVDYDRTIELSPSHPTQADESEREWSRMSDLFMTAGYREGITAGKESALQSGFDTGFAEVGAPIGRHVGNLRGLAAGVLAFLNSSSHHCSQLCESTQLHDEIRSIAERLSCIQFVNIEPPDTEALTHALEHREGEGDLQVQTDLQTARKDLPELVKLKESLEVVYKKLDLYIVFDVPSCLT
ncbi:hypothetical protein EW145_g5666 [Phellinidium pouzarii]|uniref:Protein YAE1 n=1 Tax=Phellinidium pouzarii TaxID=167371 RepID=A0A4S4KZS8_9AGAM|nr:hypothetical protein EW145_g5666 [Phellinidium pouzarii]